jgi:hypothetical protein
VGSRGGSGQEERRRGSPRRSGDGGAAGSGRRGGVPVGGRLWRGGGILGAVPRLAVEVGKWLQAWRRSGAKNAAQRGKNPADGGWQRPFKGGRRDARGGGSRVSGDAWGGAGARERGPECGGGSGASGVRGARWAATG